MLCFATACRGAGFVVAAFQLVDSTCAGRPWRYQIDYLGICNIVHYVLHSLNEAPVLKLTQQSMPPRQQSITMLTSSGTRWRAVEAFNARFHNPALWAGFFDALLNHEGIEPSTDLDRLRYGQRLMALTGAAAAFSRTRARGACAAAGVF